MDIKIKFLGSYCNDWPEIEISVNGDIVWKDKIVESKVAEFSMAPIEIDNEINIRYINKRNGPKIFDTEIDQEGNVLQDQFAKIEGISVNGSNVSAIIDSLSYTKDDGSPSPPTYGYLSFKGHYNVHIPTDVDEWIIGVNTTDNLRKDNELSSLSYYANRISKKEREETLKMLDQLEEKINRLL